MGIYMTKELQVIVQRSVAVLGVEVAMKHAYRHLDIPR